VNVGIGSDDTLYAKVNGTVKFERLGKDRKQVSIIEAAQ
jgi:large subunit ribosomal protein L27